VRMTIRETFHALLESRAEGVAISDLLRVVFASHGSDPDLSDRILHQLLGADLLFVYAPTAAR
jgi:hypothetical protein